MENCYVIMKAIYFEEGTTHRQDFTCLQCWFNCHSLLEASYFLKTQKITLCISLMLFVLNFNYRGNPNVFSY